MQSYLKGLQWRGAFSIVSAPLGCEGMNVTGCQVFVLAYAIGVPQWIWMLLMRTSSSIACGNSARLLCNLANHPARSSSVPTVSNSRSEEHTSELQSLT